ncbi:hypothetical protein DAEQUDRAFT_485811 [Daedalea quercina L-15889]|uniref:Uncharacterized protein n=1 Tax=Daedalea quercina L-15889 TaxID=1314783 RepID=A0A165MT73_9APHY|nr:hypothetical protein DAEQUDRAFT_485811 [Daedalea quercina L-15889]
MSSSPSQEFASAFGPSFIGMVISWMFFGCTIAQVLYYFSNYSQDRIQVKAFVSFLFTLEIVKMIATCNTLWYGVVLNRDNILTALAWMPSADVVWVISTLTTICVQWYYIRDIWLLLKRKRSWIRMLLTITAATLTMVTLAANAAFVYEIYVPSQDSTAWDAASIHSSLHIPGALQASTELVTNILIISSLIFILRGAKSGVRTTDNMISRLNTFLFSRALLLLVLQLVDILLNMTDGELGDIRSTVLYYPSSTINMNTTLALLNGRRRIREGSEAVEVYLSPTALTHDLKPLATASHN